MKEDLMKRLSIIWMALMGGQVIFLAIVMLVLKGANADESMKGLLDILAVGFLIPAIFMSQIIYRRAIQTAKDNGGGWKQNLASYQTATIIKGALIEGGNLFCIVALMLTDTQWLVIVIVAVLGFFFTQRPSLAEFDRHFDEGM